MKGTFTCSPGVWMVRTYSPNCVMRTCCVWFTVNSDEAATSSMKASAPRPIMTRFIGRLPGVPLVAGLG